MSSSLRMCRSVIRPHTGDHRVDDILREAIVQSEVGLQEPVVGGSVHEIEQDLCVRIGGDLISLDRSIDHDAMLSSHPADEVLAPDLGQFRVSLDFGDQPHQRASRNRSLDDPDPSAQGGQEINAEGSGVGQRLPGQEVSRECFEDEGALGRPSPVNGGLAHPRSLRHFVNRQVDEAALFEDLIGRVEDRLVGTFAAGSPPRGGQRGNWFVHQVDTVPPLEYDTYRTVIQEVEK